MSITRRIALALPAATIAPHARAQPAWAPQRSIRMVVPYAPGGGADTTARLVRGRWARRSGKR